MGCGIADILFWRDATCTTGTIRMTEKPKYGQTNGCAWRVSQLVVVGSFNLGLFKICRKRKAASLCPGLPVSASGQSREIRVLDLSPSSWWATSHSSRTKTKLSFLFYCKFCWMSLSKDVFSRALFTMRFRLWAKQGAWIQELGTKDHVCCIISHQALHFWHYMIYIHI